MPALFILEAAVVVKSKPEVFAKNEEVHNYNTRHKKDVIVPQISSSLFKNSPRYICGKIFNKVPPEIRCLEDPFKFKSKLKDYLVKRPYYSLEEYFEE